MQWHASTLQHTLGSDNFSDHKVLVLGKALAGHDHDQVSHLAELLLVVGHELAGVLAPYPELGDHPVPVYGDADGLLHLVAHDLADQRTAGQLAGRGVDEVPPRDGVGVGQLFVGHLAKVLAVGVDGVGPIAGHRRSAVLTVVDVGLQDLLPGDHLGLRERRGGRLASESSGLLLPVMTKSYITERATEKGGGRGG